MPYADSGERLAHGVPLDSTPEPPPSKRKYTQPGVGADVSALVALAASAQQPAGAQQRHAIPPPSAAVRSSEADVSQKSATSYAVTGTEAEPDSATSGSVIAKHTTSDERTTSVARIGLKKKPSAAPASRPPMQQTPLRGAAVDTGAADGTRRPKHFGASSTQGKPGSSQAARPSRPRASSLLGKKPNGASPKPSSARTQPGVASTAVRSSARSSASERPTAHLSGVPPRVHASAEPPKVHGEPVKVISKAQPVDGAPDGSKAKRNITKIGFAAPDGPQPVSVPPRPAGSIGHALEVESKDSQSIHTPRPQAPATRGSTHSEPPDSPRNLDEAFDTLEADFDKFADRLHPAWEQTPHSKRVTAEDADPQVTVHYPPEWQPPPSARKRLKQSWQGEASSALAGSAAAAMSDAVDSNWDETASSDAKLGSFAEAGVITPLSSKVIGPDSNEQANVASVTATEDDAGLSAAALGSAANDEFSDTASAPTVESEDHEQGTAAEIHKPQTVQPHDEAAEPQPRGASFDSKAPFDSTAPSAVSQRPASSERSSRAGAWAGVALAALALVGIWRVAQTPDSVSSVATEAPQERPAAVVPPVGAQSPPGDRQLPDEANQDRPTRAEADDRAQEPVATDSSESTPDAEVTAPLAPVPNVPRTTADEQREPAARAAVLDKPALDKPALDTASTRATAPASRDDRPSKVKKDVGKTQSEATSSQRPETPAAASATSIDPAQVQAALSRAAARAQSCGQQAGPGGAGTVRVVLNPAGGILAATVTTAQFQGTPIKSCIENAFRSAATAPFQGRSLTTTYPFRIPGE